jgi:4-amino-4-deoxy-L-arabinose transferase-like glycosyltransferase
MAERIFQIFVGLVLFVAGAGIIYAFHAQDWHKGHDIWDVGFLLLAEAYSIIGSLFILLGLRYAFGRHSFIEQRISRSLRHFMVVVVLLSLAILVAMIFALR